MSDHLTNYVSARRKLFDAFKCKDDYPVRILLEHYWDIGQREGVYFLNHYKNAAEKFSSVAVKSGGAPLIYKYAGYTMVIAIDCIKFAYVFRNDMKVKD